MRNESGGARFFRAMGGAMSFTLAAVFALLSVLLVSTGVRVYQGATESARRNNDLRATLSTLCGQARARDGALEIQDFGDGQALLLPYWDEGEEYVTAIYASDGALMEYFGSRKNLTPGEGEALTRARTLSIAREDDLIVFTVTDEAGEVFSRAALWRAEGSNAD